jgi:hypothetical protein
MSTALRPTRLKQAGDIGKVFFSPRTGVGGKGGFFPLSFKLLKLVPFSLSFLEADSRIRENS